MAKYNVYVEGISIEALFNKHGGVDGVKRFMRDEFILVEADPPVFPTWKTITLGTGRTSPDDFRKALSEGSFRVGDWGNDILGRLPSPTYDEETEVELVAVSVADLGFPDRAHRRDIYERAQERGLSLCPPEVGPELRLAYPDQPRGGWLHVGMEPISDSGGYPHVFRVGADGSGRWLRGLGGRPDDFWFGIGRWVFVRRK